MYALDCTQTNLTHGRTSQSAHGPRLTRFTDAIQAGDALTLRAIILRADGALVDMRDVERCALNHVIAEAGFQWQCDREAFEAYGGRLADRDSIARIAAHILRAERQPADIRQFVSILQRRALAVADEKLAAGEAAIRDGMRDLIAIARREGVILGLVSSIKANILKDLLTATFGASGDDLFAAVAWVEPQAANGALSSAYSNMLSKLNMRATDVLAIEATPQGLASAVAIQITTMVISGPVTQPSLLEGASYVTDKLLALATSGHTPIHSPISWDLRETLLRNLEKLHAGQLDLVSTVERSAVMKVSEILEDKGSSVKTIRPNATIQTVAQRLRNDKVGVMVVVGTGGSLDGIISERDLAHGIAEHGGAVAGMSVADLMTRNVITCKPEDSVASISRVMTQRRIRHLPVVDGGALIGLISIGDLLKYRLEEIQLEASILRDYAIARS
jgi:CBS domain-containing protein/beta-phosphoglucomutase-like phosphatase (HAD superfamily)